MNDKERPGRRVSLSAREEPGVVVSQWADSLRGWKREQTEVVRSPRRRRSPSKVVRFNPEADLEPYSDIEVSAPPIPPPEKFISNTDGPTWSKNLEIVAAIDRLRELRESLRFDMYEEIESMQSRKT